MHLGGDVVAGWDKGGSGGGGAYSPVGGWSAGGKARSGFHFNG